MNSSLAPSSTQIPSPAQRPIAPWRSYLLFTLCAGLYLFPLMRIILAGTDEGTLLVGAVRIHQGQVFARDFFEAIGPGTFYWLAAFFKLFGVSFLATRICLFLTSLGTGISLYFLTRQICGRYQFLPTLLLAGSSFGVLWPGISHHVDSNFFALLAIVCLVLWQSRPNRFLLIVTGLLAGITTTIHQPKGVFLLCACMAWLWLVHRKLTPPFAWLGLVTAGYLGVAAIVAFYFWSQGALYSLVYTTLIFPSHNYSGVNNVAYGFTLGQNYWTPWVTAFGGGVFARAIAAVLILPLLFAAALPLLVLILGKPWKLFSFSPVIALYWLTGWALWLSELHRKDIEHLVFGSPLLLILCIHALTLSRNKAANIAVQLLAICAVCLAGFNCAVALASSTHTTPTPVGNIAVLGKTTVLTFLREHTSPGDEVFIYPYGPSYYFLSGTNNPTRYSFLQYKYNPPSQFHDAIDDIDRRKVKYVVWDTTFNTRAAANFPGAQPRDPNDLIMEPYLESHYKTVEDMDGVHIMQRIEASPTRSSPQ